jgi:hypothetical protein
MLAPLKQRLPFEMRQEPVRPLLDVRDQVRDAGVALMCGLLGFFCFMPYPALPVGSSSAIQIGNVLTLLMAAPVVMMSWKGRGFYIYPLILGAVMLSVLKVAVMGGGDLDVSFKAMIVWVLVAMSLLIPQLYARAYSLELLTGIAVATLVHTVVGLVQFYYFSTSGEFPMAGLYVNPSFLSVQDHAQTIARYTQRPFGIFPEPSAMSSSLAPWVIFWAAELCGLIKLKREPAVWLRRMWTAAGVGGLILIIMSQSGHSAVTLAALLVFAVTWFVRSRATRQTYAVIALGMGVVLPLVLWFAAMALSTRVGGGEMGNSSWEERSSSMRIGFFMLIEGDVPRLLFGMGSGMMSPALQSVSGIDAVFSVVLNYIYETGLIGLGVVLCVSQLVIKVWKTTRFDMVFAAFGLVWLVGITITTSYEQLLPLWIALGWLTVWPDVCEVAMPRMVSRVPAGRSVESNTRVAAVELPKRWTEQ